MKSIKDVLLTSFDDEVSELLVVIQKAKEISLDFKLTPETRTIFDLINHIVQIPKIDLEIFSGKLAAGEQTADVEKLLHKSTIDEALTVLNDGCKYLKKYFEKMTDEELLKKDKRPFYETDTPLRSWGYFLPKITTHLVMHKAILWAYLKAAKADVNMFTYYGHGNN